MAFQKSKTTATTEPPVRTVVTPEQNHRTLVSIGTKISGQIDSSCDVCVEGEIEGTIRIDGRLIVTPDGRVVSESLCCRFAEIAGRVEGPLTVTETLQIRSGGMVTGDIAATELLIEQGGSFDGSCRKLKPEEVAQHNSDARRAGAPEKPARSADAGVSVPV